MSGEKTSNGKSEIRQELVNSAKHCFDGTLGSGIRYTDGSKPPAPDAKEKELCAAQAIRNTDPQIEAGDLNRHILAAQQTHTPKGRGK